MSTYNKNGLRQVKLAEKKKTKAHLKSFYQIIGQLDDIVNQLDRSVEYTEDNINEYTKPFLGRDLDNMEKFMILGKLSVSKDETENNIT
jgi:hypothetical protein